MKKSIIIPYHSNLKALRACYYSLKKTIDRDTEIIIVANNVDSNFINLDVNFFDCSILKFNENLYYPKAINIGAQSARGEILIFVDADTYFINNNWQKELISPLLNSNNIGYTSSKLINPKTKKIIDFGISCSSYNFPHPFKNRDIDFSLTTSNYELYGACAACSAIKRNTFLEIGGFDEKLVHSYSDIDLCIRLRDKGLKTIVVANSIVFHKGSSTIESGMSEKLKEDTKGIFCAKHQASLSEDMKKYIELNAQWAKKEFVFEKDYICVNLSTVANAEEYVKLFSHYLNINILAVYSKPYTTRDADYINLTYFLDYNIQSMKTPIIYFVDNFLSIKNDPLWTNYRVCECDFIIDRNYNIDFIL